MRRELAIITPSDLSAEVLNIVTLTAGLTWRENNTIVFKQVARQHARDASEVQKVVNRAVGEISSGDILLVGDLRYTGNRFPSVTIAVRPLKFDEFRRDFKAFAEAAGLDLLSLTHELIRGTWELGCPSRDDLAGWLSQFSELGDFEWVGKGVLRGLNCVSTADLVHYMAFEQGPKYDRVCYYAQKDKAAESAGPLSHAISKQQELKELHISVPQDFPTEGRNLIVEDCSLSGSQCLKFISDVLSKANLGASAEFDLRFGVLGDAAELVIPAALNAASLFNCSLKSSGAMRIEVLTAEGKRAMSKGDFYCSENDTAKHPNYIRKRLFEDRHIWGKHNPEAAKKLLQSIGTQLYRQNLVPGSRKSETWLKEAGLGAGGYALTLVLARSCPASCLPVLWASGTVTKGKRAISWQPLFPRKPF